MSSKFSQQNDALTQNQVISWLNDAALAEGPRRADLLRRANEVLLHHSAAAQLLEEHVNTVVSYAVDKNTDVKKKVITFIEEISKLHPQHLPKVVGQLRLLVNDPVVAVAKRAIQAASILYRHALMWICQADASRSSDIQIVWQNLSDLKLIILNMIDNDNEGIRTHSIKFLEEVVMLQSSGYSGDPETEFSLDSLPPPPRLPFIDRRALQDEAEHIFTLLVKFHNSAHISSVNLMACMASLCGIARARPRFLLRVTRALQALHATLPPTLSASQVNSVRKHLRMLLLSLIKHPSSNDMVPTLIQLLADTGMTQQEIAKAVPRERRSKRLAEVKNGDAGAKRLRVDSPLESQGSDSNSRGEFTPAEDMSTSETLEPAPVTEDSLLEGLEKVENVVRLVTSTLVERLPNEMPPTFSTLYTPIPNAGSYAQRRTLARMLQSLICGEVPPAPVPPPAPVAPPAPVPRPLSPAPAPVPPPSIPLLREHDDNLTLKNAVAKLHESTKVDRLSEVASGLRVEEARAEFLKSAAGAPQHTAPVPPTPTVPKLKQKVKLLKLAEITRPIPKEIKERLVHDAVKRILAAETECNLGGAAQIRAKLLALFASGYGSTLRDLVLNHVLADPLVRLDLALQWLYEEYAYMQGFARHPATLGPRAHEKHDYSYNRLLCELSAHLLERAATGDEIYAGLVRKVYAEAPLITEDAVELLRLAAAEPSVAPLALQILHELCATRLPRAHKYVPALLSHCLSEYEETREQALTLATQLHLRGSEGSAYTKLRSTIEKHALLQLGFVALDAPPPELAAARPRQPWDERLYRICMGLIMAIFPEREELIVEIARIYGACESSAKRVVLRALDGPLRRALALPAPPPSPGAAPGLPRAAAALLAECPRGADTLLTRVVHMLTDQAPPSEELVRRVRELYATRINDVRFLIPVLTGLSKQEILAALPKLIKLNPAVVKEVFNKLLGLNTASTDQPSPVSPIELLVALHLIDPNQADLKYIIKATALCFAEKQIYTQDVVGAVVQQLSEQPEVPVLMMRSVLQALTLYPALQPLVLNVLQLLLEKEVWNNKVAWEGWVKCCERIASRTGFLLVSLPARAMALLPSSLLPPLRDYVDQLSAAEQSALPPHVIAAVQNYQMRPYDAPAHAHGVLTNQDVPVGQFLPEPLPPGME